MSQITPFQKHLHSPLLLALTAVVVFSFGGCASREPVAPPSSAALEQASEIQAAEFLHGSRSSAKTFLTRLGLAVAAADLMSKSLERDGGEKDRLLYNQACTQIAILSAKVPLPAVLETPLGSYHFSHSHKRGDGRWDPAFFSKLIPRSKLRNKTLISKEAPAGYGGVLVGVHRPPNARDLFLPQMGVSAPVTAVLATGVSAGPGEPVPATLTLYNSAQRDQVRIAGVNRPLATDLSAPFAYYPVDRKAGLLGMLRPTRFLEKEGLFLTQPYDPKKIPVLMIHGLMSDPFMWLPVMAAMEADPVLREKYQFWVYAYPTGSPIGFSALTLREALEKVYKVYPRTKDMVIVNHSLGGIITHLQVINANDILVKGIFKEKAPEIMALPDDSLAKRGLVYKANPHIDRVIFVAAPHRGAPLATNPIGNFGASLIRIPSEFIDSLGHRVLQAAATASGIKITRIPNSIDGLSAKNPLLVTMNTIPIEPPFHSIIGVFGKTKEPLEKTSDSVVPYWSAHQDAALSEKIVPYPHTAMFAQPEATNEIIRILNLHLDTVDKPQ